MTLDKEVTLTLREEYDFAVAAEAKARETLERLAEENKALGENWTYWHDRKEALNVLLAQDDGAHVVQFKTFGEA